MRLFILCYLLIAASVLADGPVLYRDTATKVTSRMSATYETATGDMDMNGDEIKGLPTVPTAADSAASKQYVDDNTGVTVSASPVTFGSDTLTPASATNVINVLSAPDSFPAKVVFSSSFKDGLTADFCSTASCVGREEVGSPIYSGGQLDLTNGNTNFETSAVSFIRADGTGDNTGEINGPSFNDDFSIRYLFRPNWSGRPSSNVSLLYWSDGSTVADAPLHVFIQTDGKIIVRWPGSFTFFSSANITWRSGELYEIEINCVDSNYFSIYMNGDTMTRQQSGIGNYNMGTSPTTGDPRFFVGGMNGSDAGSDTPQYFSNHIVEGVSVWRDLDPAAGTLHYNGKFFEENIAYLAPGLQESFETITKLASTGYENQEKVKLVNKTGGSGFEIPVSAVSTTADIMVPKTKFRAVNDGDWIEFQFNGAQWEETNRYFVDTDQVGGPGADSISVALSSTVLTLNGGTTAVLSGAQQTLAGDVTYKMDFSDNSCEPDFALGYDGETCYPGALFSSATFTNGAATPALSGGLLDMNTSGEQTSVAIFRADPDNWRRNVETGAFRVMWQPNFTGNPTNDIMVFSTASDGGSRGQSCSKAATGAGCTDVMRIFFEPDGELRAEVRDYNGTLHANLVTTNLVPAAGTTYEIELNYDLTTPAYRLFVDGTLEDTDTTGTGSLNLSPHLANTEYRGVFVLGGLNSFNAPFGYSNHKYEGFAVFNAVQHTAGYTATGLPGATSGSETINTLVGSGHYREGSRVELVANEANRFELTDTASPGTDEFELNGIWDPDAIGYRLQLVRTNGHWVETSRFPRSAIGSVSAVSANITSTQTVVNATTPVVQFQTENYDSLGEFDPVTNYDFTATESGTYSVTTCIHYDNIAIGTQQNVFILKNAGTVWQRSHVNASGETDPAVETTVDIQLSAGDTISVKTSHSDVTGRNITSGSRVFIRRVN